MIILVELIYFIKKYVSNIDAVIYDISFMHLVNVETETG